MPIRVLVVDDSAFMRVFLGKLISQNSDLELVGTARNGQEAVLKAKELHPDVITMDVEMPVLNGIEALRLLMKDVPMPIVMLSSMTSEGAEATLQALSYGAVDFLTKPVNRDEATLAHLGERLCVKLKEAALAKFKSPPGNVRTVLRTPQAVASARVLSAGAVTQIVAVGASTGGPMALTHLLTRLPHDFPCPVVVVQHMPPKFTFSLAKRLDAQCELKVVEAQADEVLAAGKVYIAPGGMHMRVMHRSGNYRIVLDDSEKRNEHRPSVDVLFESVVTLPSLRKHYVLLTGMGKDGAQGMLAAKRAGAASTFAESESSCVVYGMPKAAVELNCVDEVVDVEHMADRLQQVVR